MKAPSKSFKMKNGKHIFSQQILLLFFCILTFVFSWSNCFADDCKVLRFYKGHEPVIANSKHPALRRIGADDPVIVKHRSGYSIGFSTVVCQSVWVAYRLTSEDVAKCDKSTLDRQGKKPHRDPDEISKYFVRGGWPGGNYQHGHLAPCGDMKYSEIAFEDSFNESNFCPQSKIQNSGGGAWWEWELTLHNSLRSNPDDDRSNMSIYIIAGPIYSDSKIKAYLKEKKTNSQAIIIPDSFYKISIMDDVMTCKIFPQTGGVLDVSLGEIEEKTGLKFFPGLSVLPLRRK